MVAWAETPVRDAYARVKERNALLRAGQGAWQLPGEQAMVGARPRWPRPLGHASVGVAAGLDKIDPVASRNFVRR